MSIWKVGKVSACLCSTRYHGSFSLPVYHLPTVINPPVASTFYFSIVRQLFFILQQCQWLITTGLLKQ